MPSSGIDLYNLLRGCGSLTPPGDGSGGGVDPADLYVDDGYVAADYVEDEPSPVSPAVAGGSLPDVEYDQFSGPQEVDAAADFTGATGGAWSVTGASATIDTNGLVTISTEDERAETVTVTYTNAGGAASSSFMVTITLEDDPEEPTYTYAVDTAPSVSPDGSALTDAEPGDVFTATPATWTRDAGAYTPADGEVSGGWYAIDPDGFRSLYQTEPELTVPSGYTNYVFAWEEILNTNDMDNEEGFLIATCPDEVGPILEGGETQSATYTAGQIVVADTYWQPANQNNDFKVVFTVADVIQDVSGVQLQWTTSNQDPAAANHWETMVRNGDVWEMSFLNAEAQPYILFSASNTNRMSQLRFRVKYPTDDLWSDEGPNVTVEAPEVEEPEPPVVADRSWYGWMTQTAESYNNPATRGLSGPSVQYMFGCDISPQDDNYCAIIEDVAGVWRSLGKDSQGRYTWEMSPCTGMAARGGMAIACDPTNKRRWVFTMSSDSPGGENPGIYLTTDYFDTATRKKDVGKIPGGGGSIPVFHYSAENLFFCPSKPTRVVLVNHANKGSEGKSGGSTGGVWISEDSGETWTNTAGNSAVSAMTYIWKVAPYPDDHTTWVACGSFGLRKTTNSGDSWASVNRPGSGLITSIDINPQNSQHWRICVFQDGVYETTNAGGSWTKQNISRGAKSCGRVFSCMAPGYFHRYILNGMNKTNSGDTAGGSAARSTIVENGSPTWIDPDGSYLGMDEPLLANWHQQIRLKGNDASRPQGKTAFRWSHQNPNLCVGHSRCTFWQNIGTAAGRANFRNAGIGYNGLGMGQTNMNAIYEIPGGQVCAMGCFDYGVQISFDYGKTWAGRGAGFDGAPGGNFAVAIDPSGTGAMICVTGKYGSAASATRWTARSGNYGNGWTSYQSDGYKQYHNVGWNDRDTQYCYNDKYYSRNRGQSWVRWSANNVGADWYANTNHSKFLGCSRVDGREVWAKAGNGRDIYRGYLNPNQSGQSGEWTWTLVHTLPTARSGARFDTFFPSLTEAGVFFYYENGVGVRKVDYNNGSPTVTNCGGAGIVASTESVLRTDPRNGDTVYLFARNNADTQVWANADVIGNPGGWVNFTDNLYGSKANSGMEVWSTGEVMVVGTAGPYVREGLEGPNTRISEGGVWAECIQPQAIYLDEADEPDTPDEPDPPADGEVVTTKAQLEAAITAAASGDVILLAPGNYGALTVNNKQNGPVLRSQNTSNKARLTTTQLYNCSGFTLDALELVSTSRAVLMNNCNNMVVQNCDFTDGEKGIAINNGSNFEIAYNVFNNLNNDAIAASGVDELWIHHNIVGQMAVPAGSAHNDVVQIHPTQGTSSNITIEDNDFRPGQLAVQLILFGFGMTGNNFTVRRNTIIGGHPYGIQSDSNITNLTITDNVVVSDPDIPGNGNGRRLEINVPAAQNATITGNTAHEINAHASATVSGNTIVAYGWEPS